MKSTHKEKTYMMDGFEKGDSNLTASEMREFISMCFERLGGWNLKSLTRKLKGTNGS